MLSLSEIFMMNLGIDYAKKNIVKALKVTEDELKKRVGGFEDENKIADFFFSLDEEERRVPNLNFDELICLWDVFAEFSKATKEERYKSWGGEATILTILNEMLSLNEIYHLKRGYLRCREKEKFDRFLDFIYEKKGKKSIYLLIMDKESCKLRLKKKYPIYKKFLYTSRKELRDPKNRKTIKALNVLFNLFKTYGAIILSVENKKETEYFGFWFYNQKYFKLPKAITKSIVGKLRKTI